jgi:uncharacterized protein
MRQSLQRTATVLGVSALLVAGAFSIVGSGPTAFGQSTGTTASIAVAPTNLTLANRFVSVSGDGQVSIRPDTAHVRIAVSELASTTRAAQKATNDKMASVLAILRKSGIKDADIRTSNISFSTEYDWSNNERKVLGQRVRQELEAKITGLSASDQNSLSALLDALAAVNNIEVYSVDFDVNDRTKAYSDARKLAYEKAEAKARELAALAGSSLGRVVSVSENAPVYGPLQYANMKVAATMDASGGTESSVPTGSIDVSTSVEVVFEMQ